MSKIGEREIKIEEGVTVTVTDNRSRGLGTDVVISGKEGSMSINIPNQLRVIIENKIIKVKRNSEDKKIRAMHGLFRTLINNGIVGVNKLWEKELEVVGTGYNVKKQGEDIVLKVGYSHLVTFKKPDGVSFDVKGNNKIIVKGVDKQLVGEVASKIRSIKKPDSYKGKGLRYKGERIKLKPGKKAKVAG